MKNQKIQQEAKYENHRQYFTEDDRNFSSYAKTAGAGSMNVPSVGITGSGLVSGTIVLSSSEQLTIMEANTSPIVIFK